MITRIVHNVETNNISEVQVDAEEIKLNLIEKEKSQNEALSKASAQAKLTALGFTADDLVALGL